MNCNEIFQLIQGVQPQFKPDSGICSHNPIEFIAFSPICNDLILPHQPEKAEQPIATPIRFAAECNFANTNI